MSRWTVDAPTSLDFDDVTALQVRLIDGTVAVLATDGRPSVVVSESMGRPLQVSYEAGMLTIGYEVLSWDRLLDWLKPVHDTAAVTVTVPADCPIQLGVVNATAVVCGLISGAAVKGVSGELTLADGSLTRLEADNISGQIAADVSLADSGAMRISTISGEVTLRLPADSDASVRLHSTSGNVWSEFDALRPAMSPGYHTVGCTL